MIADFQGDFLLLADMRVLGETCTFMDIVGKGKIQQYLRSVSYRFKRIYRKYGLNS